MATKPPSKPDKKARFTLSVEAFLIFIVAIATAVMLNHVFEGWSSTSPTTKTHKPSPKTPISFTHNFTGDPLSGKGWPGKQTSAMNFCEEDHIVTLVVVEFMNTVSNLSYMYFAWTTWPKNAKWPPVTNISLFLVGLTSAIFHATLKHYTQIADESSMYLLVASMDWHLYSYPGAPFSGKVAKPVYGTILWGACATVVYANFTAGGADFGIHTILFITLLTMLWPRCLYLLGQRKRLERESGRKGGMVEEKMLRKRYRIGAAAFLLGFGVWLVDCAYCYQLRALRAQVGLPWAWLTECHAWWHVLTAVGAAGFVDLTNVFSDPKQSNEILRVNVSGEEVNGNADRFKSKNS